MPAPLKRTIEAALRAARIDLREARDLLAHVLRKPVSFLLAHPEATLLAQRDTAFRALVAKRTRGVPFAYLTGRKGFYGLDFTVTKDVLIPRPETEQLVDWVLVHVDRKEGTTLADVGTGSGCIAVTLAKYLPNATLIASDVSKKALTIARKNARSHSVAERISFRHGSLLSVLKPSEQPTITVANLPYLTHEQLKNVPHEPRRALHGGVRGLELIEKLLTQIVERQIAQAILEIDPQQERWLTGFTDQLPDYHYEFLPDLAGRTRFVTLKRT